MGGAPGAVLDAARAGRFEISTSPSLLDELRRVLTQPKLQAVTGDPDQLVEVRALAAIVIRPTETVENARDPDDDRLIDAALRASTTSASLPHESPQGSPTRQLTPGRRTAVCGHEPDGDRASASGRVRFAALAGSKK